MIALPLPTPTFNYGNLVNKASPLNRDLAGWWLALPQRIGGNLIYDMLGLNHGTFNTNRPAWNSARSRPGGYGALSLTRASTQEANPALTSFDPPFSVCWWWDVGDIANFCGPFSLKTASVGGFHCPGETSSTTLYTPHLTVLNSAGTETLNRKTSTYTAAVGTWTHMCWTYDGTTDAFYANGVSQTTAAGASGWGAATTRIGAAFVHVGGLIDDVRVWRRALTANDVANVYRDSITGYQWTLNRLRRPLLQSVAAPPAGGGFKRISGVGGGRFIRGAPDIAA